MKSNVHPHSTLRRLMNKVSLPVKMKLIGLEDLKKNFKIVKFVNDFIYLKLYKGRYTIKVQFPFIANEKLACLLGHILGDGCIKSKEENVYYTNKSKELIDEFKLIIKDLFGIEPKENYNVERNFYEVYPPKTIAKFLVLCGFPKGEKVNRELTIPEWIKNGSFEIKSAFIRALFDDEGTVINSKGNYIIGFGMNKKKSLLNEHKIFMEDLRGILFSLGIYPNEIFQRKQPFDTVSLGFNIYGRYNLMKFLENIGFSDKIKREKLIKVINSYKTYGRNESKMRILDALKENEYLRTKDLCVMVNRNRDIIWKNLDTLRKEGLVKKVLIDKRGPIEKVFWQINNLNTVSK